MKKCLVSMLVAIVVLVGAFGESASARCYKYRSCDKDWIITKMVVADKGWDYDVKVNARIMPDIKAEVVEVFEGGTILEIAEFYYSAKDNRIWAECWTGTSYVYVSCKYLQPLEKGSYFYLPEECNVVKSPREKLRVVAKFDESQLILVSELVFDGSDYWAKVLADGTYAYIQFEKLDAIW